MLWTRFTAATARLFGGAVGLALTVLAVSAVAGQSPAPPPLPAAPAQPAAGQPRPAPAGWRAAYVLTHDHPVTALACSADRLAAGDDGGNLYLSDPLTGKNRVRKLKGAKAGAANALRGYDRLAFSPDGKLLFSIRNDRSMVVYTHPGDDDQKSWGLGGSEPQFHDLAPDVGLWAEVHGNYALARPNPYQRNTPPPFDSVYVATPRFDAEVVHAALSPGGESRLAVVTADGKLRVHDLAGVGKGNAPTREPAVTVDLGRRTVSALRFSAKGEALAVVGADGFARVYDAKAGQELVTLKGHGGIVFCAAFSADGKAVATGGDDHVVRVWDVSTGRLRVELRGHTDSVRAVLFDPSGRVLVSASADETVRAWAPPG